MGTIWTGQLDGTWKAGGNPLVGTTTGFVPGRFIWRHNGTTWVQVWARDTTPPATPTVTLAIVGGTKNVVAVTVKHGAVLPITRTVVKVAWDGNWPSNPGTVDGYYFAQTTAGGAGGPEEWSEFWKGYTNLPANISGTKNIPASYQTFSIPLSTAVRVQAWAQDDFYNWSSGGTASIYTLAPDPPAPVLREVAAAFNCSDAGEWSTNNNYWTSSGNSNGYGSQGGNYALEGYWFYNGQVAGNLPNMVNGLEVRAYIYRVNSSHGVSGAALVRPGVHRAASKPGSGPGIASLWGGGINLTRGQGDWYALNTGWMSEMKGGTICGLAIGGVGYTSYSSASYAVCYGRGTTGGQWYMRWQQY
jgi:hypothetical protein